MAEPATTGKCGNPRCGHAKSAHDKQHNFGCKHKPRNHCLQYEPKIDVQAHNSLDGLPGVELYQFQREYLKGLPPKYIFAADTGTGKSFMSLAHYDQHAYLKPLLILAPASKVRSGDWERDVARYFAGRLAPTVTVLSYQKFSRVPTAKQFRETGDNGLWRKWLADNPHGGYAMIVDEVHFVKNPQSGMGRAVFEVSKRADFFVGLSATPLPNGWVDAINYFKIFKLVEHKTAFYKRYVDEVRYKGFPEIRGYYHEAELQQKWNGIAKPLDKNKALDLPPVVKVPVSLPSGPDYMRVEKERLFGDKFIDNPSALLHALRQSLVEPKVAWLEEFLEGVSDNVVVFYNYKIERDQILAMLARKHKRRTVFRQDGEKHEVPGQAEWPGLHRTITLAQYQSGSAAIEMTYAATTVYFSPTYSYSNYEQSIGRINRNGQTRHMTLYLLCAPTTVERDIWGALRNKSNFSETQWVKEQRSSI